MASVGGALGGAALGSALGPVGTIAGALIGGFAGSFLDRKYILPAITPSPKLNSPELGDIAPSSGDDGRPINFLFGNDTRVPGVFIWRGVVESGSGPGNAAKGSTEVATSNAKYYVSCAVAWGRTDDAAVDDISEIRADGEVVYRKDPSTSVTSTELSVSVYTTYRVDEDTGATVEDEDYMVITSTVNGPDLSERQSGVEVTVSGFSTGANNGTFLCARADANTSSGETYLWLFNSAAVTESAGASVTLEQDLPSQALDFYDSIENYYGSNGIDVIDSATTVSAAASDNSFNDSGSGFRVPQDNKRIVVSGFSNAANNGTFRVLSATASKIIVESDLATEAAGATVAIADHQAPDAEILTQEEAANVPAFVGTVYTVFERFALNDFGLRLPQFVASIDVTSGYSRASAISTLLDRAGFASTEYDVSGVTGSHRGASHPGPIETSTMLAPILIAYNVVAYETFGVLTFRDRDTITATAIDATKLAARTPGERVPEPFSMRRVEQDLLPSKVTVKYLEPFSDLQPGAQVARYQGARRKVDVEITLPIVLSSQDACDIANRVLWSRRANGAEVFQLRLPPSEVGIEETSIITWTYAGNDYRAFVVSIQKGANRVLELECVAEIATTVSISGCPAEAPPAPESELYIPPHTRLDVLDIAPLRNQDGNRYRVYYAAALLDTTEQFQRTKLFDRAITSNGPWVERSSLRIESTLGDVVGTIPAPTGVDAAFWDDVTTIDVQVYRGKTLVSASQDLDVLNGDNHALIGEEIIGFRFASLQSSGVYRLSRLLRGRRGTQRFMGTHVANERFTLLDEDQLKFITRGQTFVGQEVEYEAVPQQGVQGDFHTITRTYKGNSQRPFAPSGVRALRSGILGYYNLVWNPVTRFLDQIIPGPVSQSSGRFWLRWWNTDPDAGGASLLYELDLQGTMGLDQYTFLVAAQQYNLMGLSPGDAHWVTVSEVQAPFGEGLRSDATFVDM